MMKRLKRIKTSTLINACLLTTVVLMGVFGYFYLKQRVPAPIKAVVLTAKEAADVPPSFKRNIYGPGSSPLNRPLMVALDPQGRVFVADSGNNQIQVFSREGKWLRRLGRFGRGSGQFDFPFGLTVRNGKLYVSDRENSRIQIFGLDGTPTGVIPDPKKHGDLRFIPLGLFTGADGRLYVSTKGSQILVFDANDKLEREFGQPGPLPGMLSYPNGLAVDRQSRIWVADSNNGRVQVFSADGKRVIYSLEGLAVPQGITIDEKDRAWVADPLQHKVTAYDMNGKLIWEIGNRGENDGEWNFPAGVAAFGSEIYVVDRENARIVVYGF